jgi:serine/threonine protein kinase
MITNLSYSSETDFIVDLIKECKEKYQGDFQSVTSSSGNSILIIFLNFAVKIYNKTHKDKVINELNILEKLKECKHVVNVLEKSIDPPIIVFETLTPVIKMENFNNFTLSNTKEFILQIANGLYYIHSKNCVHRDTGITNICYRASDKKYVFIDFENAIDFNIENKANQIECMYNDVKYFLEDISIHIKDTESKNYILNLITMLKDKCETTKEKYITFMGKQRLRTYSEIKYSTNSFLDLLQVVNSI